MQQSKTSEQIARVRPAFNSNGRLGILESLVRTARERCTNIQVDVPALKIKYAKLGCTGVVGLIEFLFHEGEGLTEVGSGSIDLNGVTQESFSLESALELQELYIGNPRIGMTPLQWLAYLAEGIDEVIPEQVECFDEICKELTKISSSVSRHDLKEL